MYSITDLKKGTLIQLDGKPYRVVEYAQKVMGRGGSIVNVRLKGLLDGAVIPKTFKGSERITPAQVESQTAQYLYSSGGNFYFMDEQTFEQFELPESLVEDAKPFLKEGQQVTLQSFNWRVINIELPNNLFLAVTYT